MPLEDNNYSGQHDWTDTYGDGDVGDNDYDDNDGDNDDAVGDGCGDNNDDDGDDAENDDGQGIVDDANNHNTGKGGNKHNENKQISKYATCSFMPSQSGLLYQGDQTPTTIKQFFKQHF